MSNRENERRNVFAVTGGKCYYCGCEIKEDNFQIDHFVPRAEGGNEGNRVPACVECNEIKSNKTVEEFRSCIKDISEDEKMKVRLVKRYLGGPEKEVRFYFEDNDFKPY